MKKLPWNPNKDVIRVPANNLGIDIDRGYLYCDGN